MSAEIVNLNQFRKARAKSEHDKTASANRKKHGRTKIEKRADDAARDRSAKHVDTHRLEDGGGSDDDRGTTA